VRLVRINEQVSTVQQKCIQTALLYNRKQKLYNHKRHEKNGQQNQKKKKSPIAKHVYLSKTAYYFMSLFWRFFVDYHYYNSIGLHCQKYLGAHPHRKQTYNSKTHTQPATPNQ
jgi:hypothetical protein